MGGTENMKAINILPTVTNVAVACDQPNRSMLVLQNDSDVDMFLKFDSSAAELTVNNGFRLSAGAHVILESTDTVSVANNAIQAIHGSTGNKILRMQEFSQEGNQLL